MKEKHQIQFYGSATVGVKGQIVIPIKLRKELNIKTGDALIFMANPNQEGFGVMKPEGMLALQEELQKIQKQVTKNKKAKK